MVKALEEAKNMRMTCRKCGYEDEHSEFIYLCKTG